jgi:carbon storage regulator
MEIGEQFWRAGRCNMLVLTRRSEESIVIGGNIVVTILSVEGEKVKLGIEAPREIAILRKELIDVIQQQNRLAEKLSSMADPPAFQGLRDLLAEESGEPEPPPPPE